MFEAYSVGVKLTLTNLISPQLALLSKEFERLDGLTLALKQSLGKISVDSAGMKGLTSAANATNRAFERAALSAATFQRQLASIHAMGTPMLPGGGGRGGGGGGGGGRRSPGGFHGGNIHLGAGGVGLGTVGMATGDWFWPLAATGAAAYGGKALYESAKDLNTEQNKLRLFGMTQAQNNEAFDFVKNMRVYGTTQTENMASFTEAQGVGRDSGLAGAEALKFAKIASPVLAKMDALGIGLDSESRGNLHAANVSFLRFAEQSGGARDTDTLDRLANQAYKVTQSSGGLVNYAALKAMTSKGGFWTQNMSDAGFGHNEPAIAEMGGDAYGTGVATAGIRLSGGIKPTNAMMHEYFRLGIWDPSKIAYNRSGGFDHFINGQNPMDPSALKLLSADFAEFYRTILKPKYDNLGITSITEIGRENSLVLGRTGGRVGNNTEKNLPILDNALAAYNKAMSIDEAGKVLQQSLGGKEAEFTAAWTDFKTQWGTTMLPFFTGILNGGANILRAIHGSGSEADAHPGQHRVWSQGGRGGIGRWVDDAPAERSRFVSRQSPHTTVHTQVNLDGQKIASVVSKHQGNAASAPQTGMSGFDSRLSLMPAGGR